MGLKSPATVANHIEVLRDAGYIEKNPQQPRTLTVRLEPEAPPRRSASASCRFVGDVAAGTGVLAEETTHELMSCPTCSSGAATASSCRCAATRWSTRASSRATTWSSSASSEYRKGEIVVAEIPGEEATVKRYFPQGSRVVLKPANKAMEPLEFDARDVSLFGKVVSVLRRY